MEVRALALTLLTTGCTAMVDPSSQPQATATSPPAHVSRASPARSTVAQVAHPLNCGTPDQYVICPLPVRHTVLSWDLEDLDLTPIPKGHVEVEELTRPPPIPPLTSAQLAEALPPIPPVPEPPQTVPPPPAPTVLSQTLIRLREE